MMGMRWSLGAALLRAVLFSAVFQVAIFAKDEPKLSVSKFDHAPLSLNYFEDSDSIVFQDAADRNVYRSSDAGFSWNKISSIPDGVAVLLVMHEFDPKTAFVLAEGKTHYKTEDRGETWTKFDTPFLPSLFTEVLAFHATDPKRIIFNGMDCDGIFCDENAAYTTDGFKTTHLLRSWTAGCRWAQSSPGFTTGDKDLDNSRTMCVVKDPLSIFKVDQRLHISDSFFKVVKDEIQEFEPNVDTDKGITGVVNLAVVKNFLLIASSSFNSDEMALFVTTDTIKWHRAIFPTGDSHDHSHRINQEAYTVLESTDYSIQVDVMTSHPARPMGVLFTSNSNGTYFTENIPYTNRNTRGHVDFEKISGIQGIYLVNIVGNGAEVDKSGAEKVISTQITFDDGRTFAAVKSGDDQIHLHSVTELDNAGRVFSSPAPGLVMGNGNKGKSLGAFEDANLYVSDDAGLNWKKALDGPHKFEFGDSGSVLIAVKDSAHDDVGEFSYSLDHGESWEKMKLPDGLSIKADFLTTTQDSTSLKFLLLGEKDRVYHMIAIDFDGLHERQCGSKDMENWHARVNDKGESTCIMGHKQTFQRRKKSADCFIKSDFKEPLPETDHCDCQDTDFECDYNFQRDAEDNSVCRQSGPIVAPSGVCKSKDDTFQGSSGWRLIPGNTCKRGSGKQKDDSVERKCSDSTDSPAPPASGEVSSKKFDFEADLKDLEKIYLDRGDASTGTDETVIARPAEDRGDGMFQIENRLWLSHNHGKTWDRILDGENIEGIYPHRYFNDVVFFTTPKEKKVIYTIDRGHSFHSFEAPTKTGGSLPLSFHPDKKDWLLWVGERCDKIGGSEVCFKEASVSTDRGDNWRTMLRFVSNCEFTGDSAYKGRSEKQVVCLVRKEEKNDGPYTIMSSDDWFDDDKTIFDGEVTGFASMNEFIVLAREDEKTNELHALASLDGKKFAEAQFPYNFHTEHQSKYTVLDSSTHAINMFVLTEPGQSQEYGSIVKSNSNGTSYVLSASNVNCNEDLYVDFERVSGLEGVTLINVVTNAKKNDKTKKLQTKITHNDGSEWGYLAPPEQDVDGKSYGCNSRNGDSSCALHIHHYTEREDKRRTFAATTAVGLLFGVGNIGSELGKIEDADTFLTTDGGVTWKNVKKGHWTWQYGDQGSIIVLAQRATKKNDVKTKLISYSIDEGKTWKDYTFTDSEVTILDVTTVKTGVSRNFLVWCRTTSGKLFSVNLDFSGLTDKACKMTEGSDSDYDMWSPKHPLQDDDCLFGHVAKYLRKKPDRNCYNERNLQRLHEYSNCACGRRDYECAYNYELDNHGQCALVQGLKPLSGQEWCEKHSNETSWFEPTGYRRVPLSTCKNGNELDKTSTEHPCKGYEDEFEKKHRTSGITVFFAVVLPFALAGAIGWYVYQNWSRGFGQIRLGDGSSATFDSDQPWIKYPVMGVSALAAVVVALPLLAASLWRTATSRYDRLSGGGGSSRSWFAAGNRRFTTRDSFARGRGDYAAVDDDEGELLGEDSDEEV